MKLSASSLILSLLLSKGALANEHSSLLQPDAIGESSPKSKAFRIFPPPKLGRSTPEDCPEESGYEVWRQLPPKDAKLRFEGIVDCDTQTYTLTLSFVPDMNVPFMTDITKTNWNGQLTNPNSTKVCEAEGRGPGISEHVPAGTHAGENIYYTDYSYEYDTSKQIQDATGFKHLTLGAGPCGTPTLPYPNYRMHFYTISKKDRENMVCRSGGGYFCLPASEQCSENAMKFNLDGEGLAMCPDGSYANVPPGFRWTIDNNPAIGINAASPAMGLHGLVPSDLLEGSDEDPRMLMVQYDSTIVGHVSVFWAGTPLGQNNPGEDYHWSKELTYNCKDSRHKTLANKASVDYKEAEGRTYFSITGPTATCEKSFTESWDSVTLDSKAAKSSKDSVTMDSKAAKSSKKAKDFKKKN